MSIKSAMVWVLAKERLKNLARNFLVVIFSIYWKKGKIRCIKMTEYWQSQAKKFCDFCKCWLTDNKPSIEFHENGKKHKDNVERRIKEVRKRGIQVRKDDDELKKSLKAIEAAALEAYKKDVGEDNIRSTTTSANTSYEWKQSSSSTYATTSTTNTSVSPETGCSISYIDGQPVVHCLHHWSIGQSDQGYYYYYNTQTNVTQWDVPSCLQADESGEEARVEPVSSEKPLEEEQSVSGNKETSIEDKASKTEEKEEELINSKSHATAFSPYGAWTTVRTIEAPVLNREPQVIVQKEASEDQVTLEDPEVTAKNTEKKFKEREIPKLSKTDEVVPFKKRKLNSERKRNIRQTKFDS